LSRLETTALISDVELPVSRVREQIAGALDLIVKLGPFFPLTESSSPLGKEPLSDVQGSQLSQHGALMSPATTDADVDRHREVFGEAVSTLLDT
jgi:hypothetical protein